MPYKIWALSDPHLAIGVPAKNMNVFGPLWDGYMEKIAENWRAHIGGEDLVLVPGDISWGMTLQEAEADLLWLDSLPGTKLILRGNHDLWWSSASKIATIMPPTVRFIHNNAFHWKDIAIGGSRLWDTEEYNFNAYVHFQENTRARKEKEERDDVKIFERELGRLRLSLQQMDPKAKIRIAMTHYPPISADLLPSQAAKILEEFGIQTCVFGHLHNLKKDKPMFGEVRGVRYLLTSCDYLDFTPIRIL